jgi:hypothetical protein
MPFEFITNLKVGTWTQIDKNWLKRLRKHLSHADNSAIKQIRLIRCIGRCDLYEASGEYEDENDRLLHQIYTTKGET